MRAIYFVTVTLFLCLASHSAHAGLKVCNHSPFELWTAVGFFEDHEWKTSGWYKSFPESCETVFSGRLTNRYYYIFTENKRTETTSGGDYLLCIDPNNAFLDLPARGHCLPGHIKVGFREIDVGDHDSFSVDLTCSSCRSPHVKYSRIKSNIELYYVHNEIIDGITVSFPSTGLFRFQPDGNEIHVIFKLQISLDDFQIKIGDLLASKINKNEECGDRLFIRDAILLPQQDASAKLIVNADAERWYCTYMDIPEFHGFSIEMVTKRTSKNKILESGVRVEMLLQPYVPNGHRINLRADVTSVTVRNDLARIVVDALRVDLQTLVQRELEKGLGQGGAATAVIPLELRRFARIDDVRFKSSTDQELRLSAEGRFSVRKTDISSLCRRLLGISACS